MTRPCDECESIHTIPLIIEGDEVEYCLHCGEENYAY